MIRDVHSSNRRKRKKAMRSRCWLNGEEVTSRCFYADDRAGVVRLYALDSHGLKYTKFDRDGWLYPVVEERHGCVRLTRGTRLTMTVAQDQGVTSTSTSWAYRTDTGHLITLTVLPVSIPLSLGGGA